MPENRRKTGKTIPGGETMRPKPEQRAEILVGCAQDKRGRKTASKSRAAEIRTKLLAWRQTPESQRISLRELARETGTSHQLLSFHFQRLDKWQMNEYQKKAREITARASGENRPMTTQEQKQCVPCGRASRDLLPESAITQNLREMRRVLKHGSLSGIQVKIAKLLASKGHREAQEILDTYSQSKNNLPGCVPIKAKPFRTDNDSPGNSAKVFPHAVT